MSKSRSQRDAERLAQGIAAVHAVRRAAELLPLDDKEALAWLRKEGLVLCLLGRECVIWGDVLERLRQTQDGPPDDTPPKRKPLSVPLRKGRI